MVPCQKTFLGRINGVTLEKTLWIYILLDGLQDTTLIYRKNSDWESIMYGLNTILSKPRQQRMRMKWKYLVFPYNEHQVEDARKYAMDLGFEEFEPAKSIRKYNPKWFKDEEEKQLIQWQ